MLKKDDVFFSQAKEPFRLEVLFRLDPSGTTGHHIPPNVDTTLRLAGLFFRQPLELADPLGLVFEQGLPTGQLDVVQSLGEGRAETGTLSTGHEKDGDLVVGNRLQTGVAPLSLLERVVEHRRACLLGQGQGLLLDGQRTLDSLAAYKVTVRAFALVVGLFTAKEVGVLLGRCDGRIGGDGSGVDTVYAVDVDGGELGEQGSLVGGRERVVECEYVGLVGGGVEVSEVGEERRVWCWLDGHGAAMSGVGKEKAEDGNAVLLSSGRVLMCRVPSAAAAFKVLFLTRRETFATPPRTGLPPPAATWPHANDQDI